MVDILVIEDEAPVRQLVRDILEYSGFQPHEAGSGQEGLRKLRQHQPDLVLCDVDMPGVNGYQVLHELRNNPRTEATPLIFLTGKQEREHMRRGMEMGADDYLTKPFQPEELLTAVRTQLKKQAASKKFETTLRLVRHNIVYALPHELRTPLFGISGYAELLKMDWQTIPREEIGVYSDKILAAADRLQRLIENFLVYAQIELISGDPKQIEKLRNHVIGNTANIVAEEAQAAAEKYERGDDLHFELCNVALQISEQDLRKIVGEIADNAFKFSAPGSSVYVSMITEGNILTLAIGDAGRGMSAEQIDSIGAFMQFDRRLHEQQGVGLGLAIARRLTELHQGQMTVESVPDRGTVVRIDFRYR
jgi:signal transduction histidine kinase